MQKIAKKFEFILPFDEGDDVDFQESLCDEHPIPPPSAIRNAVARMLSPEAQPEGESEFVERVWQAADSSNCREHIMLLMAAGIPPAAYEEGTPLFDIWAVHNFACGPDPSTLKAELLQDLRDLLHRLPLGPNKLVEDAIAATAKLLSLPPPNPSDFGYVTPNGLCNTAKRGTLNFAYLTQNEQPLTSGQESVLLANGWTQSYNGNSRYPAARCFVKKLDLPDDHKWGNMLQLFPVNGHIRLCGSV